MATEWFVVNDVDKSAWPQPGDDVQLSGAGVAHMYMVCMSVRGSVEVVRPDADTLPGYVAAPGTGTVDTVEQVNDLNAKVTLR